MSPSPAPEHRTDALPAGTRLAEFELRDLLGSGGFGIVYRAWDHALERDVAIKEYLPAALAGRTVDGRVSVRSTSDADSFAVGLRSFVNEARMLARFDHPALVKVHRFWEQHGTAYMVMPLYRGVTLRELRRRLGGAPDEAACRRLLVPLLSALECLHAEGVYHRDIAPDNILVGADSAPVLLDFGAARQVLVDQSRQLTAILKPNFSPLEQYAGESALRQGPWTDVYGLAATLYFMLAGHAPTPATARALHDELMPLVVLQPPGCSAAFLRTLDWGLALQPGDRPQSIAAWREVFDGQREAPPPAWQDTTWPGVARQATPPAGPARTDFDPTQPWPWTAETEPAPLPGLVIDTAPGDPIDLPLDVGIALAPAPAPRRRLAWAGAALVAVLALTGGLWLLPQPGTGPSTGDAGPAAQAAVSVPAPAPAPAASAMPPPMPEEPASRPAAKATPAAAPKTAARTPTRSDAPAATPAQPASRPVADAPDGPREACGGRVFIALARCMQRECARPAWRAHPECERMRREEAEHYESLKQ